MNDDQIKMLYQLDERTKGILHKIADFEETYVDRNEFEIMKRIMYGIMLGFISTVSAYMLTSILNNNNKNEIEVTDGQNPIKGHDNLYAGWIEWDSGFGRSELRP